MGNMSRRSRLIVITALGALSCRQETVNPPPVTEEAIQSTPPESAASRLPPLAQREAAKSTAPLPDTPAREATQGVRFNPVDDTGRLIQLSHDSEGCYVNLPFPPDAMVPPGTSPPRQVVTCPPIMADPAWLECATGWILAAEAVSGACLCEVMGNPPPPPRWVHCPTGE
ncbi:MAG: hypothetical protein ACI8RZ_002793 [Myxococcota bacterium]|jgi:hypothetical protein